MTHRITCESTPLVRSDLSASCIEKQKIIPITAMVRKVVRHLTQVRCHPVRIMRQFSLSLSTDIVMVPSRSVK